MSSRRLFSVESGENFTKISYNDTYAAISPKASSHSGKVVFINGASKGIGRATALSYAKSGVSGLIISGRASLASVEREIEEVCKSANTPVPKILALKLDVLDFASVEDAAKSIETTFGRLDILINNAGYFSSATNVMVGDKDEWWMNLEVNMRGVYWVTKCLLPLLLKTDGGDKTIVNVTSVAALLMTPGMSGYQLSKFALVKFTETLCVEFRDQDLLAYSVHPGAVVTDLAKGLPEELHNILVDTPELAADTIPYLTSQKRKWLADPRFARNMTPQSTDPETTRLKSAFKEIDQQQELPFVRFYRWYVLHSIHKRAFKNGIFQKSIPWILTGDSAWSIEKILFKLCDSPEVTDEERKTICNFLNKYHEQVLEQNKNGTPSTGLGIKMIAEWEHTKRLFDLNDPNHMAGKSWANDPQLHTDWAVSCEPNRREREAAKAASLCREQKAINLSNHSCEQHAAPEAKPLEIKVPLRSKKSADMGAFKLELSRKGSTKIQRDMQEIERAKKMKYEMERRKKRIVSGTATGSTSPTKKIRAEVVDLLLDELDLSDGY
ncbi:hypothetical protein BHYA_0051g00380 [Botrytis hyacinthi]|uniref:Uncharacterized protein n=1 Tax=Botrytis hyacinthi TaxID=278943 RepID=A0A4Z1H2J6_9HELO|nr:hypothetical protein BHYA_0051g00380 [Botrytis hyacinthi]